MTNTSPEYAVQLAEQTANAITAARGSLLRAADLTDEVDGLLRRSEDDIMELSGQAGRVLDADEPQVYLRNAQGIAEDIDRRLRHGRQGLGELTDYLEQGARDLNHGRQFLAELEELPGQRGEQTEWLRQRLDGLSGAAEQAGAAVEEASRRLQTARGNIEPILAGAGYVADRDRTAATIREAGAGVNNDVEAARGGLRELREGFEESRSQTDQAAYQSVELATALRAGLNPTPADRQTGPAAGEGRQSALSGLEPHRRTTQTQSGDRER